MTNEFIKQAEQKLVGFLKSLRSELLGFYGNTSFVIKDDKSPVTDLDKSLEIRIRELLIKLDPGIGIEGEEFGLEGRRDTYWLVDPIDGTDQFIRGINSCKMQICLVDKGLVIWSLIYYFVRGEMYIARRGHGAQCNGEKIRTVYRPLPNCLLEISANLDNVDFWQKLLDVHKHISDFRITKDISLIFTGRLDGAIVFNTPGGPWDYAPRALFHEEVGLKITNIGSNSYDFRNNNFLVAHPKNHQQLMEMLV